MEFSDEKKLEDYLFSYLFTIEFQLIINIFKKDKKAISIIF